MHTANYFATFCHSTQSMLLQWTGVSQTYCEKAYAQQHDVKHNNKVQLLESNTAATETVSRVLQKNSPCSSALARKPQLLVNNSSDLRREKREYAVYRV